MLNAMHALDTQSLHYQVRLTPDQAEEFLGGTQEVLSPAFVHHINEIMPKTNRGHTFHTFLVGREFSRVVYVEVVKNYRTDYTEADWNVLERQIKWIGRTCGTDERDTIEDTPTFLKIRVWWD